MENYEINTKMNIGVYLTKEQIKELDEQEIEYKLLLSEDLLNHLYEGYIYRNGNMRILMNPIIFYIKELTGDPDNNLYTIVGKRELENNEKIKEFTLDSIVETYMKLGLTKDEFIETYDALTEYNESRRK